MNVLINNMCDHWQRWSGFDPARLHFVVQIKPYGGLWAPNTKKKYWSKIISVERFHNDCALSNLGQYIDDKFLLLDISWNIAVFKRNKGFLGDYKGT